MGELKSKYGYLNSALDRLYESVEDMEKAKGRISEEDSGQERKYRSARDSTIKRFEITIELFWKYIKKYLDEMGGVKINAPKPVIRQACNMSLIEVEDAEKFLEMADDRNMTSHIYKEEIADKIGSKIPIYYKLMKKYIEKFVPKA